MVPGRPDEVDELQLEYGSLPVRGKATSDPKNCRFGKRRIVDLLRKFGRKLLRQAKDAALRVFDIFAEDDAITVFLQAKTQCLVDGVANTVFAGRQNLVVQLGQIGRDLDLELVGRRIFRSLSFGELASDALFNLPIQFCVFVRREHAVRNQPFGPAF